MIARKSALIMLTNIINGILGYVAIFLIARYMDAPDYALGVIGFAYGFVALFVIFSDLGFDRAHIKRISEGKNIGICIGTFFSIKIFLTAVMVVLLVLAIVGWKYLLGKGFESPEHETAVYIMLVYFVLWSLTQSMRSTYNARKEIAKAQIPMFFETLGRVAATVVVVFNGMGIIALAYTYVIGEIVVFITTLFFFRGYRIEKPSMEYVRLYVKFALPLAIVVASTKIMTNIDKVLIQLFWDAVEGGNYYAVFRLSRFLDIATLAIGTLLFPTMSALHANNDLEGIKKLSFKSERYLSMVISPIIFFMVFLAKPVVHILLSDKFYPAIPILQILPFFALFDALDRPYQSKLMGMDLPHFARNRVIIMVTVNVILNIILIPRDIQMFGIDLAGMGAVGAAIATVVAYFVGLVYTRIQVWKISKMHVNYRIVLHFIAAFIMGVTLFYLDTICPVQRWYDLITFGLIGMGIYLAILYLVREFDKTDFNLFIDTINAKKMLMYIREEIRGK